MIDFFLSRRDRPFPEGTSSYRYYLDQKNSLLEEREWFLFSCILLFSFLIVFSSDESGIPSILLILRSFVAFLDLLDEYSTQDRKVTRMIIKRCSWMDQVYLFRYTSSGVSGIFSSLLAEKFRILLFLFFDLVLSEHSVIS